MNAFESTDARTMLAGRSDWLDADAASALARHPLESVGTAFPHWVGAIESPDDVPDPREDHPVFYGCFDWHSAVHSHWCLVRLLRLVDDHPDEHAIRDAIDERITAEAAAGEVDYFAAHDSFEKPYGWAWFLRLAAELHAWPDEQATAWRTALRPLEERLVELVEREFLTQERPLRVGTHGNSAFALSCVLDYATVTGNDELATTTRATARRFFADDTDAPIGYEPLGWDFLSPTLTEADLMRRVLGDEFGGWFDEFLPDGATGIPDPVAVDDAEDGHELHLVGLNLSRAWCLAGIADALAEHCDTAPFERHAARHLDRGLTRAFTDDYAGAHWLSSFVLYAVTRTDGGIAPR